MKKQRGFFATAGLFVTNIIGLIFAGLITVGIFSMLWQWTKALLHGSWNY